MSFTTRLLCIATLGVGAIGAQAAEAAKDPAPRPTAPAVNNAAQLAGLEFAGVSMVGSKTMINLFDKQEKRSFWMEVGATSSGLTVVSYDSAHDQVLVRQGTAEKLLPLRAGSAVINGGAAILAPSPGAVAVPAPTSTQTLSQARQEEEARMLVSDLLEIGMVQRKAYEEAQRRAALGQSNPTPSTGAATATPSTTPLPTVPASTSETQPAGVTPTPTPST